MLDALTGALLTYPPYYCRYDSAHRSGLSASMTAVAVSPERCNVISRFGLALTSGAAALRIGHGLNT